jgi:hypothetical protein
MHLSSLPGCMPNRNPSDEKWYHQPVLWLGALIFAASLIGCIVMIVVA